MAVRSLSRTFSVGLAAIAFLCLGTSFVVPQSSRRGVTVPTGAGANAQQQSPSQRGSVSAVVPLLGLAAMCSLRTRRPSGTPMALVGQSLPVETMDEPATVMHTAGGRRKRLGVGGRICMLTGVKKIKGVVRTYHLKKNCRYWRPNTMWKNLWWDKEKKWVRLYICVDALPYIDDYGLDHCAKKAGLDLYAWTKDHWEPGSRQPLRLKVSDTGKAKKDKKIWPDYEKHLNQGKPLAEIFAGPEHYRKPIPWNQRKAMTRPEVWAPKGLKVRGETTN